MNELWKKIAMIVLVIAAFSVGLLCSGCKSTSLPERYAGQPDVCYEAERCRYQNQYKDTAQCAAYEQECRAQRRYIFCKESLNRWETDTPQNCWDKLNQK